MAADIGGLVSYWNSTWGGYGGMSNDIASIRNRLVGVGFASTYGLQELWNQSRRFRTGAGKCFVRNSAVLMDDLSWKMIYEIEPGDMVFSPTGPAKIERLHKTSLGDRKMCEMSDGTLEWSSEHMFWTKQSDRDWFWTMSRKDLDTQIVIMNSPILKNQSSVYEGQVDKEELFAHIGNTWKRNTPKVSTVTAYNYPLLSPITENGELIVVNGYLVDSCSDESKQDYTKIKWEEAVNDDLRATLNNLPYNVKDYHDYRASPRYEPPIIPENASNSIHPLINIQNFQSVSSDAVLTDEEIVNLIKMLEISN
jgi:hypothetical protein